MVKKKIYIIPGLKEISVFGTGYSEGCDPTGANTTLENCIGDYNSNNNNMVKRNYNSNNNSPNTYLSQNNQNLFKIIDLNRDKYYFSANVADPNLLSLYQFKQNWKKLFTNIYNTISNENITQYKDNNKIQVYICGHQHNLGNKLFNFKKSIHGEYISYSKIFGKTEVKQKKYGFRNCTCVKVSKDNKNLNLKVVYAPQADGTEKKKNTII